MSTTHSIVFASSTDHHEVFAAQYRFCDGYESMALFEVLRAWLEAGPRADAVAVLGQMLRNWDGQWVPVSELDHNWLLPVAKSNSELRFAKGFGPDFTYHVNVPGPGRLSVAVQGEHEAHPRVYSTVQEIADRLQVVAAAEVDQWPVFHAGYDREVAALGADAVAEAEARQVEVALLGSGVPA